jgi:hypothetical protein
LVPVTCCRRACTAVGLGLSSGLAWTTGALDETSWGGLNSRSLSGFGAGAGDMGRETGCGGGASWLLLMFSNRARREETGLMEEPSGPSP